MQIVMAQINTLVGDWSGNKEKVLAVCRETSALNPEAIVVFPELTLTGYPPEDLLLRPSVGEHTGLTLAELCTSLPPTLHVIVGYP
ncbi:MAG: NAD+ synthase, partial [Cellvibrionales bacterium]|nr:NAD+ synthase [Cellvibrionales bacterium]